MEQLDDQAQRLLALLSEVVAAAEPGDPRTYIGYKKVHERLGLTLRGATWGESLKRQGLMALAEWTLARNLPAITGLVIDGATYLPGEGYFSVCGRQPEDFGWWKEQIERAKEMDWSPFLSLATMPDVPRASDLAGPAGREELVVYRILRDTRMAMHVKMLHRHAFQICGSTIELPGGLRYAEAHHIQPLGRPHDGPDTEGNILCLCPNHHAELDFGARHLDLSQLRIALGHRVDELYIRYHNDRICNAEPQAPQ